jgi:hypothetical protein
MMKSGQFSLIGVLEGGLVYSLSLENLRQELEVEKA